jgi:ribosomal protein S11
MEIDDDTIIAVLDLPSFNVSRQDAGRFGIQLRRMNSSCKATAMHLLESVERGTKEWRSGIDELECAIYMNLANPKIMWD